MFGAVFVDLEKDYCFTKYDILVQCMVGDKRIVNRPSIRKLWILSKVNL